MRGTFHARTWSARSLTTSNYMRNGQEVVVPERDPVSDANKISPTQFFAAAR